MSNAEQTLDKPRELFELPGQLYADAGFVNVVEALRPGQTAVLDGVWGSASALVTAALAAGDRDRLTTVVLPLQQSLEDFRDDLALFSGHSISLFPAWETDPRDSLIQDEFYGQRLSTLKRLRSKTPPRIVVTCIQALQQPVPSVAELTGNTRLFEVGQEIEVKQVVTWLAEHGFHATSAVELPGEFATRGGILDVFALDWCYPVRIEMFDTEIESIRRFDVSTQRSLEELSTIDLTVPRKSCQEKTLWLEHLPTSAWIVLVEPEQIQKEGTRYLQNAERANELHSVNTIWEHSARFTHLTVSGIAAGAPGHGCHLPIESVERFTGEIGRVREELDRVAGNQQVFVICPTAAEIERLQEVFAQTEASLQGRLHLLSGRLKKGFRLVSSEAVLISSTELFRRSDPRRSVRRWAGKAIDSFLDLKAGDLVVHLAHGIGRYRGLALLNKQGQVEEHLKIEFHAGTTIFVPAARIELVQKYVGGRKARPRLASIGGQSWVRQKKAAEAAVTDLAGDLLRVQAERAARTGIAFGDDTDWQREFDASFPYEETPDQLKSAAAIRLDMISSRSMERLLCGDVGYGKTEMAMRAAFRAVDHGFQVGILVPTTILAEQHFNTFRQRMAQFPFSIAKLSRFCSSQEQRVTLRNLQEGTIDIVIGTHRLASKDVAFQNLGLLIIDEEQRFGVEVKERLKSVRSTVDVLTLSATPIPRTLHMSLTGMRDISNLETAPEDRIAVETRVTRWNDQMIRHALLRELNRDGQAYFVHNRVHDIEAVADKIRKIVPEASLGIGHGQMPEADLEKVMFDFIHHRFDILLATTIVESGLDIPNANTIFINDSDRYGLADLHQLRGRVGRYKHRAYCYLLLNEQRSLTPNAARRLRAIEEYSEMGAGFAIAMRDLEIRGAGNILGTQQSGHIATVGYELYCQLLETAVRKLKKLPPKLAMDVNIELPGEAFLPADYVDDQRAKIDLYRRFARTNSNQELSDLKQELIDRFGEIPDPVNRMLALIDLRTDATIWRIDSIHLELPYLVFSYTDDKRAKQLVRTSEGKLRLVDDRHLYLTLDNEIDQPDQIIAAAKSVLRPD